MSYQITDISSLSVDYYPYYYCDANVWIAALKYYGIGCQNAYELPYQTFIEAIVNLNEINDPQVEKRIKNKPKIILSSLVLSEIVNAFMRNVAMKAFFGGNDEYCNYDYKRDYRDNASSDYKSQLTNLCTDILSFKDYTILLSDEFNSINPFDWITQLPTIDTDFNDLYYYKFLIDKNIPFVTHDKDFKFQDIPIITANPRLLKLRKC